MEKLWCFYKFMAMLKNKIFFSRKSDSTITNVRLSVCLFVCPFVLKTLFNLNPSSFKIHPSSFKIHPSSFNLHPLSIFQLSSFIFQPSSFILQLLSFSAFHFFCKIRGTLGPKVFGSAWIQSVPNFKWSQWSLIFS